MKKKIHKYFLWSIYSIRFFIGSLFQFSNNYVERLNAYEFQNTAKTAVTPATAVRRLCQYQNWISGWILPQIGMSTFSRGQKARKLWLKTENFLLFSQSKIKRRRIKIEKICHTFIEAIPYFVHNFLNNRNFKIIQFFWDLWRKIHRMRHFLAC